MSLASMSGPSTNQGETRNAAGKEDKKDKEMRRSRLDLSGLESPWQSDDDNRSFDTESQWQSDDDNRSFDTESSKMPGATTISSERRERHISVNTETIEKEIGSNITTGLVSNESTSSSNIWPNNILWPAPTDTRRRPLSNPLILFGKHMHADESTSSSKTPTYTLGRSKSSSSYIPGKHQQTDGTYDQDFLELSRNKSNSNDSGIEQVTELSISKGVGLTRKILYKNVELNKRALFEVCQKYGRSSPEVLDACQDIKIHILALSMSIKEVWPMYIPEDPNNIVFVAFCEPELEGNVKMPQTMSGFDIVYRTIGEYRNDDEDIPRELQLFQETEQYDQKHLADIVRKTSSHLMKKHSNLNIMTASPFRSKDFGSWNMESCIVFYVRIKGYIPIQEEELPRHLGSYTTDIREGAFSLYNDPDTYAQRLKMGCSIGEDQNNSHFGGSWGTLGAFVDLGRGSVGCITSAHVLLDETQFFECKNKNKKDYPNAASTIYQPAPTLVPINDKRPFGRVTSVVYKTGGAFETGVEVGLIAITDPSRYPENGTFPKIVEDFTETNQLNYMSGSVLNALPTNIGQCTFYKYGATTGLTRGAFKLQATAVRTNSTLNVWGNCELHNQIEVVSLGDNTFAKPGDSGALVLLAQNDNLHAIGIVTGGTTDFTKFYVTPIWEVLNALGFPLQLKNFHEHVPMEMDTDSIENASMSPEIDAVKININEVKSNFEKEIKTLSQTVDTKFGNMEKNVRSVDRQVASVNAKVRNVETNVSNVETKVGNMETKVDNVERKVDMIGSAMRAGFDEILKKMK